MRLYRACGYSEAYWTMMNGAAGGVKPKGCCFPKIPKQPTAEEVANHMGMEGMPPKYAPIPTEQLPKCPPRPKPKLDLVEYTTDLSVAIAFSRSTGWLIECNINSQHLTKGSGVEKGFIARIGTSINEVHMVVENGELNNKYKAPEIGTNSRLRQQQNADEEDDNLQLIINETVKKNGCC